MRRNQFLKKALSVTLATAMALTVSQATTFAETDLISNGISSYAAENNETYKYVYAGLTWSEYWKSEGVYESDNVQSSDEEDSRGEYDKGGFDAVSRATTNHGIHRGSFQCNTTVYDEDGNEYNVLYWLNDENGKGTSSCVLTGGRIINFAKGTITYGDEADNTKTAKMKDYVVTGIKYVPVAVSEADYEAFKEKYITVENGEKLFGGYSENNLKSFEKTANVTANTNGLKIATKNEDGSFTFGKRQVGTESGILDQNLAKDEEITVNVLENDDIGAYGEFMRVDLKGNYGGLGANMQAVEWTYYGNDASYDTPVISYGTKFAADNWMHKANGIQLGLTDSIRCKLPEGSDGTGYWKITVYALGYEDYEIKINATKDNVKLADDEAVADTTELAKLVADAAKLNEKDYTAASWKVFTEEFDEAKAELANPQSQATVNEAIEHLKAAMESLEKVKANETTKETTIATTQNPTESKKETTTNPGTTVNGTDTTKANNDGSVKKPDKVKKVTTKVKKSVIIKWRKQKNVTGYQIRYSVNKKMKKANIKTITKNNASTILKKLKPRKYFIQVRAYKLVNGKKVTGKWSSKKTVVVKKKK